ncbi:MAG: hypothetical protein ACF8R7_17320 [Phycisphaerales bacterium JB039]
MPAAHPQNTTPHATNGHIPHPAPARAIPPTDPTTPPLRAHNTHDPDPNHERSARGAQTSRDTDDAPAPVPPFPHPLSSRRANPPTAEPTTDRPTLPDHIDPDELLFDYYDSADDRELAARHGLGAETLFAWAEHPHTRRMLARLRAFSEKRADDIRAYSACAAVLSLYRLVHRPMYMVQHISIPAELRSQEITLKAALAILNPIERARTFKHKLNLRRALAALNPRRNVPLTAAVSAPRSPTPFAQEPHPAASISPKARPPLVALASGLCDAKPPRTATASTRTAPPTSPPGARASSPRRRKAPNQPPCATPNKAPMQPQLEAPTTRASPSIPAQLRISAPRKPSATSLLDQSGALPRAP